MPSSPERFIEALTRIHTGKRKPYIYLTYYYEVVFGVELPRIPATEERILNDFFSDVFYASKRLDLPRPIFPMTTVLHLIVDRFPSLFTDATRYVVRFGKKLRCAKRRRRYRHMFRKCIAYIKNAPSYHAHQYIIINDRKHKKGGGEGGGEVVIHP